MSETVRPRCVSGPLHVEPRSVLSRARFSVPLRSSVRLLQRGDRSVAPSRKSSWNIPQGQGPTGPGRTQSEFGVATCQGFFAVVTRLKVEFAAEAALFEFSSGFSRSHLVSRRSSGNAIKDSLSGIVWFLHGFVLQPREARGLQVRRSPAAPAQRCWKTGSVARRPLLAQPRPQRYSGPRRGPPRPHRIRSRGSSCDPPSMSRCHAS